MTSLSAPRLGQQPLIVVGVDGSAAGTAALRWAAAHASALGARVEAVMVYSPAAVLTFAAAGAGPFVASVPTPDPAEAAAAALAQVMHETRLTAAVDAAVVSAAHPWQGLAERSRGALMLVVGGHRHRALDSVLGSTARSCLHHAQCPVLVVPEDAA